MSTVNTKLVTMVFLVAGVTITSGCARPRVDPSVQTTRINEIIAAQADAWNRGEIDEFMSPYWRSEQLTFSSGGSTKRGWETTRDGYKRRYPTRDRMGRLEFSEIEITPLGDDAALVLGRWRLAREPDSVGGNFSLVFKRINNQWKIIHDHTSSDEP